MKQWVLMHMLDFESVAETFFSQWIMYAPLGWTGSKPNLWQVFLNNSLVLGALIRSSTLDERHCLMMMPYGHFSLILQSIRLESGTGPPLSPGSQFNMWCYILETFTVRKTKKIKKIISEYVWEGRK